MIDVTAPVGLLPADRHAELTRRLLTAERAPRADAYTYNTGAFVHELPTSAVATAAESAADVVRVEVLTPPGALSRDGQRELVAAATDIVTDVAGRPELRQRVWVLLSEAAEGGWGIGGVALGREEFAAARAGAGL
jgi:phenylpyruvate tautomerase PptA (4-oxalocrotonate tautomerase family)